MILVGTAGFKFADWKGKFYPQGVSDKDMLSYYANHFPLLEIDYSYYTMPFARTLDAMASKVPNDFVFCVKAHKSMTHEIPSSRDDVVAAFTRFNEALRPLEERGKFGCILAQFPWAYRPSDETREYLKRLPDYCGNRNLVVEFRNREWVSEDTFALLSNLKSGFCCVDEPRLGSLMPPMAVATSRLAYIRFHGRNAAKWWSRDNASERYNYLYNEQELTEWASKIRRLEETTDKVYVLFNNCHEGQAAQNALDMMRLLNLPKVIQLENPDPLQNSLGLCDSDGTGS